MRPHIDDYLLDCRGKRLAAAGDPVRAGLLNMDQHRRPDAGRPAVLRRAESRGPQEDRLAPDDVRLHHLRQVYPGLPQRCQFHVHRAIRSTSPIAISKCNPTDRCREIGADKPFRVEKSDQIANFADYCNHCGNCDTFCPEYDGPYLMKPSFFGSREAFEAGAPHDGFHVSQHEGQRTLLARIAGHTFELTQTAADAYRYADGTITLVSSPAGMRLAEHSSPPPPAHTIDMGRFHALATLLKGITADTKIHAVNTALVADCD